MVLDDPVEEEIRYGLQIRPELDEAPEAEVRCRGCGAVSSGRVEDDREKPGTGSESTMMMEVSLHCLRNPEQSKK